MTVHNSLMHVQVQLYVQIYCTTRMYSYSKYSHEFIYVRNYFFQLDKLRFI